MEKIKIKPPKELKPKGDALGQSLGTVADAQNQKYETQEHLRKLSDAFDIMGDPEKMKRVHALAGRHVQAINSLQDIRDARDSAFSKPAASDAPDLDEPTP